MKKNVLILYALIEDVAILAKKEEVL